MSKYKANTLAGDYLGKRVSDTVGLNVTSQRGDGRHFVGNAVIPSGVTYCRMRVTSRMASTATSYSLSSVIDTIRSCCDEKQRASLQRLGLRFLFCVFVVALP